MERTYILNVTLSGNIIEGNDDATIEKVWEFMVGLEEAQGLLD